MLTHPRGEPFILQEPGDAAGWGPALESMDFRESRSITQGRAESLESCRYPVGISRGVSGERFKPNFQIPALLERNIFLQEQLLDIPSCLKSRSVEGSGRCPCCDGAVME